MSVSARPFVRCSTKDQVGGEYLFGAMMPLMISKGVRLMLLTASLCLGIAAQTATPTPPPVHRGWTIHRPSKGSFVGNIVDDQKAIWTSPFRIRRSDWSWLAPTVAATGVLIATDKRTSAWVGRSGSLPTFSRDISWNGGVYAAAGVSAGMWAIGHATGRDHLAETGRLASEALVNSQIVTQVSKLAFGRLRPNEGDGEGRFFKSGRSFVSGHASSSWSVATVVACEYPDHSLVKWIGYGLASAVSLSRYTGRKHFLSDVFVGAAVGYGTGRYVCEKRSTYDDSDPDSQTFSRRWHIAPYLNARTGARGGSVVLSF
jgi:membrane-associated phospholipid phosphatase